MTFLAALPALASAAASAYSAYQSSRTKDDKVKKFDIFNPNQKKLIDLTSESSLKPTQQGLDWISQLLSNDPEAFSDFEAPALRQFEEDIIPKIMERFGAAGAMSSSGLNQTLAREGRNLSESLAAQRAGLKSDALSKLIGFQGQALTQPQGQYLQKGYGGNPEAFGSNIQNIVDKLSGLLQDNTSQIPTTRLSR